MSERFWSAMTIRLPRGFGFRLTRCNSLINVIPGAVGGLLVVVAS